MRSHVFVHGMVTVEARSPLIVSTGGGDAESDAVCVADANGLPMLPGTSLAGVLRHAMPEGRGNALFGFQEGDKGQRSRLSISHARLHDSTDTPVSLVPREHRPDPVLDAARAGVVRDHVRLTGAGVADTTGKFDERLVPTGARWTFDIVLDAASDDPLGARAHEELADVLAPLRSEDAAIGGRTRRGFGAVRVVRAKQRTFDLGREADRKRWQAWRASGEVDADWQDLPLPSAPSDARKIVKTLTLEPEDFWMFGRGEVEEETLPRSSTKRRIELTPVRESVIRWNKPDGGAERGEVTVPEPMVPASGIKGALWHRALYHARRLEKEYEVTAGSRAEGAIRTVFGYATNHQSAGERDSGQPGRVCLRDGRVTAQKPGALDHVSIDRFTGGPVDGRLFSERPLFGGRIELRVAVERLPEAEVAVEPMRLGLEALAGALRDLGTGRLAIGGGTGRGHGFMKRSSSAIELADELLAEAKKPRRGGPA